MNREFFLDLLSRKLSGKLTVEEDRQFVSACNANVEYAQLAAGILNSNPADGHLPEAQLNKVWHQIAQAEDQYTEQPFSRRLIPRWFKVAAAVLIIFSAGLLIYKYPTTKGSEGNVSLAAAGQKIYKTLDDGSAVCLNHHTIITYNTAFGKDKREISLQGEAFFDVAKNPAIPLHIRVGGVNITVKGTAFNVSERAHQVTIALVRGHITVSNTAHREVALQPNQQLIAIGNELRISALDTTLKAAAISWTRDTLVFKKEKLVNLVLLLERKYRVKIQIKNEKLKTKQFSGVIKKEQLNEALEALKLSYPFSYVVNNKVVTIN